MYDCAVFYLKKLIVYICPNLKFMKKWLGALMLFFCCISANAQPIDSIAVADRRFSFRYQKTYLPAGLMAAGIFLKSQDKNESKNNVVETESKDLLGFKNHVSDYAQFLPYVGIYAFEWLGMKPKTDWKNRTAILAKGQLLNLGLVYLLKKTTNQTRPDGTSFSFPSGHTANAFAGATMLSIEYGEHHKWVPYAAYGVATGVGVMRVATDKHYFSDVLFGAGLGILSMKIAYWTHQYQWNKSNSETDPFLGSIY